MADAHPLQQPEGDISVAQAYEVPAAPWLCRGELETSLVQDRVEHVPMMGQEKQLLRRRRVSYSASRNDVLVRYAPKAYLTRKSLH